MKKAIAILILILFYGLNTSKSFAAPTFTVTEFDSVSTFRWVNGPASDCSAINSYVITYPGNNHQSHLNACAYTFGTADDPIPDGIYFVKLTVGGTSWNSQIFTIQNKKLFAPTATPTPSPTPVNKPPLAVAGTSLDENGNLQLDASLSTDPENKPLTYIWKISGENTNRAGKKVSLATLPIGTYDATLTVSDGSLQTVDILKFGVVNKRPASTIAMKIDDVILDKKNGKFIIQGQFDRKNPLLSQIQNRPLGKLFFEIQNGVIGEDSNTISIIGGSRER